MPGGVNSFNHSMHNEEEVGLSVPQMGPEGEAQPDLGRRETK